MRMPVRHLPGLAHDPCHRSIGGKLPDSPGRPRTIKGYRQSLGGGTTRPLSSSRQHRLLIASGSDEDQLARAALPGVTLDVGCPERKDVPYLLAQLGLRRKHRARPSAMWAQEIPALQPRSREELGETATLAWPQVIKGGHSLRALPRASRPEGYCDHSGGGLGTTTTH